MDNLRICLESMLLKELLSSQKWTIFWNLLDVNSAQRFAAVEAVMGSQALHDDEQAGAYVRKKFA